MKTQQKKKIIACVSFFGFLFFLLFLDSLYAQQAPKIQWQKCLGGTVEDRANSIIQTSDGGYIYAGYTYSLDGDVLSRIKEKDYGYGYFYGDDIWVVKLNSLGNIQWQKCL